MRPRRNPGNASLAGRDFGGGPAPGSEWRPVRTANQIGHIKLLDGFEVREEAELISLPSSAQRLVAFLALHDRPLLRPYVCGSLWLDTTEGRARGSLRSALWRLRRSGCALVEVAGCQLRLRSDVVVDVREVESFARRVLDAAPSFSSEELDCLIHGRELLPGWYEDWILIERERFRQLRLHALESLCLRLTTERRFGEATEAGMAAVATEPLRESANRVLIEAHLAEGNAQEAQGQYRDYRDILHRELGLEPSARMAQLAERFTMR